MKSFTIDGRAFKAACFFKSKKDHRAPLLGVLVQKDGSVAATNGHTLIHCQSNIAEPAHPTRNFIIKPISPVLASHSITFDFVAGDRGLACQRNIVGEVVGYFGFVVIEGKYPDWKKAIPQKIGIPADKVILDATYINSAASALKALGVRGAGIKIEPCGELSPIMISPVQKNDYTDKLTMLIMPMRGAEK